MVCFVAQESGRTTLISFKNMFIITARCGTCTEPCKQFLPPCIFTNWPSYLQHARSSLLHSLVVGTRF